MRQKIVGVIALYQPTEKDINNIVRYVDQLDYCLLMDDSGSNNKSVFSTILEQFPDKICYIQNKENYGLCVSVNRGFREAVAMGSDWVLVMNPDGYFSNDAIQIYRQYMENHDCHDIAMLAPQFNFDRHPRTANSGYQSIKYADMTGCLYNSKILEKLEFYDENTYFDGLDTEYCLRVKKNGYKIIQCNEAVLNHHPANTRELIIFGKKIFSYGIDSPVRYYYQFRSGYYIHKKYLNIKNDLFMLYKYLKILFLFENKVEYKKMIKKGIKDAKREYYGKYQ